MILYQSIEDGSIALKADDDIYEDKGYYKDFYTDAEILSGVSFKMKWVEFYILSNTSWKPVLRTSSRKVHHSEGVFTWRSKKRLSSTVFNDSCLINKKKNLEYFCGYCELNFMFYCQ